MFMDKVRTIIGKEWAEVFKNRLVLFSVAFLPLLLVAIPLITLAATSGFEGDDLDASGELLITEDLCQGMTDSDCVQLYMLDIFALLFMMLPVTIPVTIAAYSIVGEKTARSLEPLLATPITTAELLIGKMLAAMTPAILATWMAYTIFLIGVRLLVSSAVFSRLLDPLWLLAIFVVGPLLTILAVCLAIIVSSRVTDPRVAEQLSALVILPIILILVGQSIGLIIIDQTIIILAAIVLIFLDVILVYLAIKIFQREQILTRWK